MNGRVRSIPLILILSIVTCGIYPLVWYYEASCELQNASGKSDMAPGMEVILIILTCGLYTIAWWYKYGTMLARVQAQRGLPVRDNSVLLTALSAVGIWYGWMDLVNMAIMQSDMNAVWERSV